MTSSQGWCGVGEYVLYCTVRMYGNLGTIYSSD